MWSADSSSFHIPAQWYQDPYPVYRFLRETPIHAVPAGGGSWLFPRYADCHALLRDPRLSAQRAQTLVSHLAPAAQQEFAWFTALFANMLPLLDGAAHRKWRRHLRHAFETTALRKLAPGTAASVESWVEGARQQGCIEIMQTLAIPLPSQVICELVGVPPALRADVLRLSRLMAAFVADLHAQVEVARRAQHSAKELHLLLRDVFLRCRACPGDDLISELAPLVRRDSSEEEDLLAQCMILLVTGHETTSGLLANCLLSLLTHRAQWRLLQREPSLVDQAVEETLRYESPAQYVTRVATEDLRLHGQSVQRGQPLVLLLGSANRDTSHFKEPDRFDITRQDNRHLAFGHGVHHCLGAHLARMEARIALATFLRCFPNAQLDREVSWMEHLGLRAPRELFLRVHG